MSWETINTWLKKKSIDFLKIFLKCYFTMYQNFYNKRFEGCFKKYPTHSYSYRVRRLKKEIFSNERKVMNFRHIFITKFYVTLENFPGYWINTHLQFFFRKWYFKKCKNIFKINLKALKENEGIHLLRKLNISSHYLLGIFFSYFVNNFSCFFLLIFPNVFVIFHWELSRDTVAARRQVL